MYLVVHSSAFQDGAPIPEKYTGDGDDVSPPLSWTGAPPGTREFALICEDPDAPSAEPWVHWVVYRIPAGTSELPEDIPAVAQTNGPVNAVQGKNSWPRGRTTGYRGPAPPPGHGVHHYQFKLYALDDELNLQPGATRQQLLEAIQGHVLAAGELIGTYER